MLKAVLFDLDYTLIDWDLAEPWEDYQFRRLNGVFECVDRDMCSLEGSDPASFFEEFATQMSRAWQYGGQTLQPPDIRTVLEKTIRSFGVPSDRLDIEAALLAYDWQPVEGERAYPDVVEVLPLLQSQGVELGIVTNASHPMVWRDRELQAVGLIDLFPKCRIAAVDVGFLKPHRTIFDRALQRLGVQAEEAVFVGDNLEADIRGAQGAGMSAVWRTRPGDSVPADCDVIPDGIITTLHDLLTLLDVWYPGWRNGHTR